MSAAGLLEADQGAEENAAARQEQGEGGPQAPAWHAAAPDPARFPPAFLAFLRESGISVDNYRSDGAEVRRFVRVNPRSAPAAVCLDELRWQLGPTIEPVPWLPGFFSLSCGVKIASSSLYTHSHIYGLDAASGAAVAALGAQPGEHVLDVCCAPGAKLCMLAEAVGPAGTVTGVDIAQHRLAACRTLCTKYALDNARLFLGDGSTFSLPPPPQQLPQQQQGGAPVAEVDVQPAVGGSAEQQQQRRTPVKRLKGPAAAEAEAEAAAGRPTLFHEGTRVACQPRAETERVQSAPPSLSVGGYDRVLVDAECTHDGSVKHLSKFAAWGWETFEKRFLEPERLASLESLQRALLRNGFGQLKPGGSLVYSTCSFARRQNEGVVEWLLACEPSARCVPLGALLHGAPCRTGSLEDTVRFEPCSSGTSALFIAKIQKLPLALADE
ncbi:S-adenosyl-L-methionine-dependent methyltransferase [Pavlovales sp. CCMP2436]|nr:S-adenosyl-L-methionine-dependent methyltransferase [Pavlovales sp. CCMP2436]